MEPDRMNDLSKSPTLLHKTGLDTAIARVSKLIKGIVPELTVIFMAIWTIPGAIAFPGSGIDPSWKIGVYVAAMDHMQFGKDIIFTFGPLGFLGDPILVDYQHWAISMAFMLLTQAVLYLGIYLLLKRISAKWYLYLLIVPPFTLVLPFVDYKLLMGIAFIMYAFILKDKLTRVDLAAITGISLLLAVASFIKFNMFVIALSIIILASVVFILEKKNLTYPLYLALSYVVFLLALWVACGQNLANLADYVMTGIEISSGYNDAMVIQPTNLQTLIELAAIGFVSLVSVYAVIKGKTNIWLYVLLNAAFFVTVYKYGLIRNNVIFYLAYIPLLTIFTIILLNEIQVPRIQSIESLILLSAVVLVTGLIMVLYPQATWILANNAMNKLPSYTVTYNLLTDPGLSDDLILSSKDQIRQYYALDQSTISHIGNDTVDVFPWDIAICWAYSLNWSPRPVFQSYSTYTERLDEINAGHFTTDQSPQKILYSYKSIDNRYPQLDEPETFRAIVYNYRYSNYSDGFILLERNEDCGIHPQVALGTTEGKIGEIISIPEYNDGYLYGKIGVDSTLYGKVLSLLYKPEQVNIRFVFKNGSSSPTYRLLTGTAGNGLFLSSYVASTQDLIPVFQGELNNDISGIVIDTPDRLQYDSRITIEYMGVPMSGVKISEA